MGYYRVCAECSRNLDRSSYSNNQWLNKGPGESRCASCVAGGGGSRSVNTNTVDPTQTARRNNATQATFTQDALNNPFAEGSFRYVAKGRYTHGNRAGEACVCKWFKTGGVIGNHFFESDIQSSNMAVTLITKWNEKRFINRMVKINLPEVWTFSSGMWQGQKVLQEPFITNYEKFNSNTGWSDDSTPWPRVMQAVSHFSYHISNGSNLLCDLQGGVYNDGVVLTDPVVMSMEGGGKYGPTDLGSKGISTFFAHHECNEFCRSDWRKPRDQRSYFRPTAGTTMTNVRQVPTRRSRAPMTSIYEG
mmetsp:Transcript_2429/g.4522  ORF Transcript_2429/g.4522 Transcript_2429/m.4522 type:complete len:304 (-) Transcript_2429:456-1367(-)